MRIHFPAIALASLALSGCDMTSGSSGSQGSQGGNSATGQAAVQILSTTQQSAADGAANGIAGFQDMPMQVGSHLDAAARADLASANAAFRGQIMGSSMSSAAKFGLAVTSLALKLDDYSDTLDRMWNNGLHVGSANPEGMFRTNPLAVARSQAFALRALQSPDSLATLRALQNSIETGFLPTVDSVVSLLADCWNDSRFTYRFPVSGFSDQDSLTIGRADVGLALAGVMSVRGFLNWFVAQDIEAGFHGQGFATDYAWLDTLADIDPSAGPSGSFQTTAFRNLQGLFSSSSSFLGVRTGYQAKVNAIPADLVAAANIAKDAANYSARYQGDLRHGLVVIDTATSTLVAAAMDSVRLYLSGPRTYSQAAYAEIRYAGYYSCGNTYCYEYDTIRHPAFQIRLDLAKAITLKDRKVFLPRFQWNATSDWKTKGPFSLLGAAGATTFQGVKDLDPQSASDLKDIVQWDDPTFGGIFPDFSNSNAVLLKLDAIKESPVAVHGAGARALLPTGARF